MGLEAFSLGRLPGAMRAGVPFLDHLPTAVMLCEPRTFVICYANTASLALLKSIEHVLPVKAEQIVGSSIDIFHKTPRVGEAGRGFAVVAQEVKALAMQTASTTQAIRQQVTEVQNSSEAAASTVSDISANVRKLSEVFTALSTGVEEQVVTNRSVSEMITGVSDTTGEIRDAALRVRSVANQVGNCAGRLNTEVGTLLKS